MSLRAQAERDLGAILENPGDFGLSMTVQSPLGVSRPLTGRSTDVSLTIDPDTGQFVTGRRASATLRISSVLIEFGELPVNVPTGAPWLVTVTDITGAEGTFKVSDSMPDRTLGVVILQLECYGPAVN